MSEAPDILAALDRAWDERDFAPLVAVLRDHGAAAMTAEATARLTWLLGQWVFTADESPVPPWRKHEAHERLLEKAADLYRYCQRINGRKKDDATARTLERFPEITADELSRHIRQGEKRNEIKFRRRIPKSAAEFAHASNDD